MIGKRVRTGAPFFYLMPWDGIKKMPKKDRGPPAPSSNRPDENIFLKKPTRYKPIIKKMREINKWGYLLGIG